jgi:hypothetical protein
MATSQLPMADCQLHLSLLLDLSFLLPRSSVRIVSALHSSYTLVILYSYNAHIYTAVIDRTAQFVARSANPPQFEDKIRENQRNDPKFSFLNPADPYHAYYRHRLERALNGEPDEEAADTPDAGAVEGVEDKPKVEKAPVDPGKEPPVPDFILDLPNISAIDL